MDDDRSILALISRDPQETFSIGVILGENLKEGDIVALVGELGSGKTCLAQGIAKGLNVPESYQITSPTFNIINEYPGRIPFYHMDLYRLENFEELEDMGYEEYFYDKGVIAVEWADKICKIFPKNSFFLYLSCHDESVRKIEIHVKKNRMTNISSALIEAGVKIWL